MDIVTVSAVAGSVASCVAVLPLGISGVKRTRAWWQDRRDRREAKKFPQVIKTTQDTGAHRLDMDEILGLIDKQAEGFRGGSVRRSTVINTGAMGYDIDVLPQL